MSELRWPDDLLSRKFAPRQTALTAPTVGIFDAPNSCVNLNFSWLSHILGALETLTQPDSWAGNEDAKFDAIQAIESLIEVLSTECGPMNGIPVAMIFPYAGAASAASLGCLPCAGGTYNRVDYPELYAALESVFILNADQFKTPDLRGRFIAGVGQHSGGPFNPAIGVPGGAESVTLTVSQIPAHHHKQNTHTSTSGALSGTVASIDTTSGTIADDKDTDDTGGGASHPNLPPYMPLHYLIKAVSG